MANTISYPKATAKSDDLILGTSMPLPNTNDNPRTVNFSVGQINGLANSPDIATAAFTVTDAQIQTLGTAPVEILPGVSGYAYQILGINTIASGSGAPADSYNWTGDGVFYGQGFQATQHRVEIPNTELPSGGGTVASAYIATPIAGTWRTDGGVNLSTTTGANPTKNIGENPIATWKINITYRLIQVV
jgi:hypothetical protein